MLEYKHFCDDLVSISLRMPMILDQEEGLLQQGQTVHKMAKERQTDKDTNMQRDTPTERQTDRDTCMLRVKQIKDKPTKIRTC